MRIAQVAPLYESVPPKQYGGTERIVSYLTEELVRAGHEVTLFASGDSVTRARLIAPCPASLRQNEKCRDFLVHHVLMLEKLLQEADRFDIVHFHVDYLHYPILRRLDVRNVTTLHGRLDLPDLVPLYREFRSMPAVSISDAQRRPLPFINWQATIHHGLPSDLLPFTPDPDGYLAFLGRISPEKGCDRAIEIARRTGLPLRIAAKVSRDDQPYFNDVVRPLLKDPRVEFLGEIGDSEKARFLGRARALLFPIDWPEPFGLVMIEAMACGTPTLAISNGSVPEVLEEGVTGFTGKTVDDLVDAVGRLDGIDRRECRRAFERRFVASRMTDDYLDVYRTVLNGNGSWKK